VPPSAAGRLSSQREAGPRARAHSTLPLMPRGYMEGPASEEAERRAEEHARGVREQTPAKKYPAVFGCTEDDPEPHFIGWRVDVDPDELFTSGKAWGVTVRRVAAVTD